MSHVHKLTWSTSQQCTVPDSFKNFIETLTCFLTFVLVWTFSLSTDNSTSVDTWWLKQFNYMAYCAWQLEQVWVWTMKHIKMSWIFGNGGDVNAVVNDKTTTTLQSVIVYSLKYISLMITSIQFMIKGKKQLICPHSRKLKDRKSYKQQFPLETKKLIKFWIVLGPVTEAILSLHSPIFVFKKAYQK